MIAPRGMLGFALILWGVATGQLVLGIAAGGLMEGLRALDVRRDFAPAAMTRWLGLSALSALAMLVYVIVAQRMPDALYIWLRWLPLLACTFPVAQILTGAPLSREVLLGALRVPMREAPAPPVEVTQGYIVICLLGAATSETAGNWFYAAASLLISIWIVSRAPAGARFAALGLVSIAAGIGLAVHLGLSRLQSELEDWSVGVLQDFISGKNDPFRERTRIGDIGRIKLSDRIVLRVLPVGTPPAQILLREATFDIYAGGEWRSRERSLVPARLEGGHWVLQEGRGALRLTVRRSYSQGKGLLALPPGARGVARLPAGRLDIAPTGAVRVEDVPHFLSYEVDYDAEPPAFAPTAADLEVPLQLAPVLDQIIEREAMRGRPGAETVAVVRGFFASRFTYSLYLGEGKVRTLADFLLRDHSGHCEYFATATVLMLRHAGVPARYVAGYAAQEFSKFERAFLVRHQHAHAWVSAYVNGHWIDIDTTPSVWAEVEAGQSRNLLTPLFDALSWLTDLARRDWIEAGGERTVRWEPVAALAAALTLLLAWHRRRKKAKRKPQNSIALDPVSRYWRTVEATLAVHGSPRHLSETALAWVARLEREGNVDPHGRTSLAALIRTYYDARFDPASGPVNHARFVLTAKTWLADRRKRGGKVAVRVPRQQIQWSQLGAHLLLQTRTRMLNEDLEDTVRGWYPGFQPPISTRAHSVARPPWNLALSH